MIVLSLFDGISCGKVAFERAGIKIDKYYASEIDPYAIKVSKKNHPDIIHLGDVIKWRKWDIPWEKIDILIGGSPCQSLSIIQSKTRKNLNGKSKLFFEYVDILNHVKKANPDVNFLFENVSSMNSQSKNIISDLLGCQPVFIDSADFSAQSRPRLYWTNIPVNQKYKKSTAVLGDVLQKNVPEKYFYKQPVEFHDYDKVVCATLQISGHDILKRVNSPKHKCQTLTTCGGGNTQRKVLIVNRARKLTPVEYERLQTLPDDYTAGISDTRRYNCLGNGWTVDVIAHIFKGMKGDKHAQTDKSLANQTDDDVVEALIRAKTKR